MAEETTSNSESESDYSPLLAKMLNVDPKQAGSISLSGLGRKIVGAESAEYKKKLDEVTAAQNAMIAALDARKNRIDPGALALAAGFFAPTRTGTFGENLGLALGNLSKVQEQESNNAATAAKMKYELAKSGLADEETMAKLGLSAVKALTPKLTKLQQQVVAEGLDPNSVEGRQRLVMLQFLETATPEVKDYFYLTGKLPEGVAMPSSGAPAAPAVGGAPAPAAPAGGGAPAPPVASGYGAYSQQKRLESQATQEMKEFAAMSGLSLSDPSFATRFSAYKNERELIPVAARMGLNLDIPEDKAKVRAEMQRAEFIKTNPEVAKALATFGGDPLNPADLRKVQAMLTTERSMEGKGDLKKYLLSFNGDPSNPADLKKAAQMLKDDLALERESKVVTIKTAKMQAARLGQEIAENTRAGNIAGNAAVATRAGVPYDPVSLPAGMTPKEAAVWRADQMKEANKYIAEKITPFVNTVDEDITNLERAKALNAKLPGVGSLTFGIPGIGTVAKATTGAKAQYEEFDSLASQAAAQNKIPNNPSVSNADLKFMERGVFNSDKERSSNDTIISFMVEQRKRDKDYYRFMSNYAAVNGKLGPTANRAWRDYADANPITVRDSKGAIILNPNRVTAEQFYSMPTTRYDAQGRPIQ
jgi:hypothetical protein